MIDMNSLGLNAALELMDETKSEAKAQGLWLLQCAGINDESISAALAHKDEIKARFQIDIEKLMIVYHFLDVGASGRELDSLASYTDMTVAEMRTRRAR